LMAGHPGTPVTRNCGRNQIKKKAWLVSHARTTTRRMEEPFPARLGAVTKSFQSVTSEISKQCAKRQ